ncbi:MAG: hypothetical protein ACRDSP_26820 [Pseudonocardiaceae bacterium]
MAIRDGEYLNHGQPVAGYLADALDELLRTEHLALGRTSPSGHQQVCVTQAGQSRYADASAPRRCSSPVARWWNAAPPVTRSPSLTRSSPGTRHEGEQP